MRAVPRVILFNKPCGVLTQFTPADGHACLADYLPQRDIYPAGRLDADSEGLVVLTDDGGLQALISEPRHKLEKTYWVQVEGAPTRAALATLQRGIPLGDFVSAPCSARAIDEPPELWARTPPIRYRASIPTGWLEIRLREGKNRQVRRMTAAIGCPTLRLIRFAVGDWTLDGLSPGAWREGAIPDALAERLAARQSRRLAPDTHRRPAARGAGAVPPRRHQRAE